MGHGRLPDALCNGKLTYKILCCYRATRTRRCEVRRDTRYFAADALLGGVVGEDVFEGSGVGFFSRRARFFRDGRGFSAMGWARGFIHGGLLSGGLLYSERAVVQRAGCCVCRQLSATARTHNSTTAFQKGSVVVRNAQTPAAFSRRPILSHPVPSASRSEPLAECFIRRRRSKHTWPSLEVHKDLGMHAFMNHLEDLEHDRSLTISAAAVCHLAALKRERVTARLPAKRELSRDKDGRAVKKIKPLQRVNGHAESERIDCHAESKELHSVNGIRAKALADNLKEKTAKATEALEQLQRAIETTNNFLLHLSHH